VCPPFLAPSLRLCISFLVVLSKELGEGSGCQVLSEELGGRSDRSKETVGCRVLSEELGGGSGRSKAEVVECSAKSSAEAVIA
jgi:hypothetical protein